jgi:hypothetical protein
MNTVLSDDCIYNILGHLKNCWDYTYPTGHTLETAIYRGIKPFYVDAQLKGAPSTFTDVGKGSQAFDIKGSKKLGHIKKVTRAANENQNIFCQQTLPNGNTITVKIPFSTVTQVRRPKVNLKGYKGNSKKTLNEQIGDYYKFAIETSTKEGYKDLYSIVCVYGIDKGYKSVFLTVEQFSIPECVKFDIGKKEDGTPCSYQGYDINGNVVFSLSSFNSGSSNFYKRFYTTQGILMTWPEEDSDQSIFTKEILSEHCAIQNVTPK